MSTENTGKPPTGQPEDQGPECRISEFGLNPKSKSKPRILVKKAKWLDLCFQKIN